MSNISSEQKVEISIEMILIFVKRHLLRWLLEIKVVVKKGYVQLNNQKEQKRVRKGKIFLL